MGFVFADRFLGVAEVLDLIVVTVFAACDWCPMWREGGKWFWLGGCLAFEPKGLWLFWL